MNLKSQLLSHKPLIIFSLIALTILIMGISMSYKNNARPTNGEKTPKATATGEIPTPSSATENPSTQEPITLPSQILNLTNWKITLPVGESEKPTEIKQTELKSFSINPWFLAETDKKAVRFRAPVNGVTTSGSDYPRSELREMKNNGMENASWNSNEGVHSMFIEQAVTAVPNKKQDIVVGQIHDSKDDIIVIRLNLPKLHIRVDGKDVHTLDESYTLGKKFSIKFVVENNQTKVYYNNSSNPVYTLGQKYSNSYFKAGAYTQSNCDREESASLCSATNYGEVLIYSLSVNHN